MDPRELLDELEREETEENQGSSEGPIEGDQEGVEGEEGQEEEPSSEPFRFGDDAPEDLRGKTPAEVAGMVSELKTAGQMLVKQVQERMQQEEAQQLQAQTPKFDLEDLAGTDPDAFNQKLSQFFETKAAPYVASMQSMRAQSLYGQAFQTWPHLMDFKDEVDVIVQQTPRNQLADPNWWNQLNGYIMNNHVDEIAERRRERMSRPNRGQGPTPPESPGGSNRPEGGGSKRLNAAEAYVAKQFGMKPDEYAKAKKEMFG